MSEFQHQWIPQGWQCPVCRRVYSPTTTMCLYCGERETTVATDGTGTESLKQIWMGTMRKDFDLTYAPPERVNGDDDNL